MARVYLGRSVWLEKPLGKLELAIYKSCGIDPYEEMGWKSYVLAILVFSVFGFALLFAIFIFQGALPLNPEHRSGLSPDLAFNAAISFLTNTNWQSYSGEAALSYFSQAVGIVVQQFISAATGMAVAVALFRGLARKQSRTIGNAWADIVRGTLYILLPMASIFALILVSQGVIQNIGSSILYQPLEAAKDTQYAMAQGPVASMVAIKMLGSNGGGFFNANGAHPFENPTALSNALEIISILLIPAAFTYLFGVMAGDRRQGWALLAAMLIVFLPLVAVTICGESFGNPQIDPKTVDAALGNMEGKEMRFGTGTSAFWAAATTATSNGSVNAMHGSFMPLSGMVPILLMQFGEVIFGGVGSGMYGMLGYVLLAVFIGGLMVGRTPEYLGKKLGPFEIKMASLMILLPSILTLIGTAIAVSTEIGRAGVLNSGAQGFSEVLYAFSSASNNNGSAFAGLNANTPFYNVLLGIAMFLSRYWTIGFALALAGSLASKNITPTTAGTLPTATLLFTLMLVGVIVLLGVLTLVPALALGPIAEHMSLWGAP